jgi:hypothetical protein
MVRWFTVVRWLFVGWLAVRRSLCFERIDSSSCITFSREPSCNVELAHGGMAFECTPGLFSCIGGDVNGIVQRVLREGDCILEGFLDSFPEIFGVALQLFEE